MGKVFPDLSQFTFTGPERFRSRCRRARGGQQFAGQDKLVRWRSQLGPHSLRPGLFDSAGWSRSKVMSDIACPASGRILYSFGAGVRPALLSRRFAQITASRQRV